MSGSHTQPAAEQRRRISLRTSLLFHACLLALLAVWYVRWSTNGEGPKQPAPTPAASVEQRPADDREALVVKPGETAAEAVGNRLNETIAQSEQLTEEENRDKLDEKLAKLEEISSEESIDQLTGRFQEWLSTEERAAGPAESVAPGEFDFDTAQLHDVLRQRGEDGRWQYRSVLIDAAGRTMEAEMGEAEGESTYRTLQRLKSNPLAEKVYRQIAMPLLDKLLKAQRNLPRPVPVPAPADSAPEPGEGEN